MKTDSRHRADAIAHLKRGIQTLFSDECGLIASVETLLLTVVMAMGLIAGLKSLNSGVVQEIADTAVAIDHIDQTYTFTVTTAGGGTQTSSFTDASTLTDPVNAPPAGLSLDEAPVSE